MSNDEELGDLIATLQGIRAKKPWEFRTTQGEWSRNSNITPRQALGCGYDIRLKPVWTLGREVNGHTLPDGREWFKGSEFTEGDLPEGYRPLMVGEIVEPSSVDSIKDGDKWRPVAAAHCYGLLPSYLPHRTKRPIVPPILTPAEIADGWVEWHGGPCPVEPESIPSVRFRRGSKESGVLAKHWDWSYTVEDPAWHIIAYKPDPYGKFRQALADGKALQHVDVAGDWKDVDSWTPVFNASPEFYRIKPDPVRVPLEPGDVPVGSVIRRKGEPETWHWRLLSYVDGLKATCADRGYLWEELARDYEILRPGQDWQPCYKES